MASKSFKLTKDQKKIFDQLKNEGVDDNLAIAATVSTKSYENAKKYVLNRKGAPSPSAWNGNCADVVGRALSASPPQSPLSAPSWFKINEPVEIKRTNGKWHHGTIIDVTPYSVKVEYSADGGTHYQKEMELNTNSIAQRGTHLLNLAIGDTVEVRYDGKTWVQVMVVGEQDELYEMQFFNSRDSTYVEMRVPKTALKDIAPIGTNIKSMENDVEIPPPPPQSKGDVASFANKLKSNTAQEIPASGVHVNQPTQPMKENKKVSEKSLYASQKAFLARADETKELPKTEARCDSLYREGDVLDVRDKQGKWYPAEVLQTRPGAIYVHFVNFDRRWDEWLDLNADQEDIAPFGSKSDALASDPRFEKNVVVHVIGDFLGRGKNRWVEGIIVKVDRAQVMVQYEDMTATFRKWYFVPSNEIRLPEDASSIPEHLPLNKPNETIYSIGDFIEIESSTKEWQVSEIIFISGKEIEVRLPSARVDWIHVDRDKHRIRELSKADEELRRLDLELTFIDEIHDKFGFKVEQIDKDGNCLYRSTSFLIYGTIERHEEIRKRCFAYMRANKDYFGPFIFGDFDAYLEANSKPGVWAGEPEIVALAEIFNKRVEIYIQGMGSQPSIRMNENFTSLHVMRLSYHGKSHYNAVIDPKEKFPLGDKEQSPVHIREERIRALSMSPSSTNDSKADDGQQFDLNSTIHALRRLTSCTNSGVSSPETKQCPRSFMSK